MPKTTTVALFILLLAGCMAERGPGGSTGATYRHVPVVGPVATAEERAACDAVGGTIRPDGIGGYEQCIQVYPDAGEICSDPGDCFGRCLHEGAFVEDGTPLTGRCQPTDSPFGCTQEVVGGRAGLAICVD